MPSTAATWSRAARHMWALPARSPLTIRLTGAGKRLLRAHRSSLHTTASERFLVSGTGWTTMTKRFTL